MLCVDEVGFGEVGSGEVGSVEVHRTENFTFEVFTAVIFQRCHVTILLRFTVVCHMLMWAQRDLNPRPSRCKRDALAN